MPLSASAVLIAAVYAGIQGLLLSGVHTDIAGSQRGAAGGALIEIGSTGGRFGFRFEGIPPVSLPQAPSERYGAAIPQLSLFNGAVRWTVDPSARLQVGIGATVINQRTPLPNYNNIVASRLAGMRYEAVYRRPVGARHFLELVAGGAPRLTGADHYFYDIHHPGVDEPEAAAEEDAQAAFGVRLRRSEFLIGLRTIGFSARFLQTGALADRNNGGGIMAEWRPFIGP